METMTGNTPQAIQDETLLISRILDGQTALFRQLASRYAGQVLRMVARLIPSHEEAEEVTQDVLLEAFQSLARYDARQASFQTWLMRIAYNVFYDHCRKKNVECGMLNDDCSAMSATSDSHSSFKIDLYAALALLKPDERTCITLQLIDGYDIQKITEITGIKEGTVKSHLSRGKDKMATYLKNNGYDRR